MTVGMAGMTMGMAGITEWGAGMTADVPSLAQATKSPPFAKGGLGGFYTYTYAYIYTYTSPRTAASLMLCGTPLADGVLMGDAACRSAARGNPPNPPFAKGGLLRACAVIPAIPTVIPA